MNFLHLFIGDILPYLIGGAAIIAGLLFNNKRQRQKGEDKVVKYLEGKDREKADNIRADVDDAKRRDVQPDDIKYRD